MEGLGSTDIGVADGLIFLDFEVVVKSMEQSLLSSSELSLLEESPVLGSPANSFFFVLILFPLPFSSFSDADIVLFPDDILIIS